jgi:hypothetical protein
MVCNKGGVRCFPSSYNKLRGRILSISLNVISLHEGHEPHSVLVNVSVHKVT